MNEPVRKINWKKNLLFIWLSQLLSLAGFAAAMPFIPVYMRVKFGIEDPNLRGWYVSMFYFFGMASFAVFTPIWGLLADRYGRKLMLLRASFGAALLMPCMAFAPGIWTLIGVRFLTSMCSGTVNAAQTLIVSTTPEEKHGFALGSLSSVVWSGNMLGYLAGATIVHYFGYTTAFLFCGGMYLISGILVLFFVRENPIGHVQKPAVPEIPVRKRAIHLPDFGKTVWMILSLFLLMAFARRFDEAYLALQVENIAGHVNTELHTGWISALAACGGVVAGVCIGYLVDHFSPGKVAFPAIVMSALFVLGQGFAPTLAVLGISRFFTFVTAGGLEPVFLTMLSKASPPERRGQIFGWSSTFRTCGLLLAAPFGGTMIYHFGVRSVYVVAACGFVFLIPFVLYAIKLTQRNTPGVAGGKEF